MRVELRPSAVTVRSLGGLPEPVTVEDIQEASAARDLVVINVFHALGLAEDAGRGVDVMQDTMAAEMLDPRPGSWIHGHEVVVELPVHSAVAPSERAWVRELEQHGALRGRDRIALVSAATPRAAHEQAAAGTPAHRPRAGVGEPASLAR